MSASNPASPEPVEIAGRFQVVHKLGAGAFGTVYKVRDKVLGRMLAIKTIRLEGLAASKAGLSEMLDRFKREAQVAAQLKHPNIVTIYDIGESEGLSYLSMELIDGVGLDRVISEGGRLPVERAAALALQVADALDYAHRHGVVHRDIKPANIMIEPGDRVKVTDFGIAKVTDSADHLTMTGSLLGTPSYMSPEQARGGTLDGRSDLFSLGCVLYEMVAGKKAFRGESITALLFKIIAEEPSPVREIEPTLPDEMVRIIGKALSKAPETRYRSGRELADDLVALTKPGALPTLRAAESRTQPLPEPGGGPTTPGSPTAKAPASSLPTLRADAVTQAPQPAATAAAPLAATILTPAAVTAARPPVAAPPLPTVRASAPPVRVPARKGGGGLGLALGLGALVVLMLAAVGVGGWILLRRAPAPAPSASPGTEAAVATSDASPASPVPAESTPAAEATVDPNASPANEPPNTTPAEAATASTDAPSRSATRTPAATQPPQAPRETSDAGPASTTADYSHLDEIPAEGPDGRAVGEALGQKYRSGGSSGLGSTRFARRGRFPRNVTLRERPAVATLAYLLFAQEAYQRSNSRYGSLQDLKRAGLLNLDVPVSGASFQRARYRFELNAEQAEFKATATPLGIGGRPFVVDDSGFVRVDE